MRQKRYKTIASVLSNFDEDHVRGLCVALLMPLTDDQIINLVNQLKNIRGEKDES